VAAVGGHRRRPDAWSCLRSAVAIDDAEPDRWQRVAAGIVRCQDPATGRIEQSAGYFGLDDVDLDEHADDTSMMETLGREGWPAPR
jgi:trehalose/maltose hydrolase-like predicted phosphorylase